MVFYWCVLLLVTTDLSTSVLIVLRKQPTRVRDCLCVRQTDILRIRVCQQRWRQSMVKGNHALVLVVVLIQLVSCLPLVDEKETSKKQQETEREGNSHNRCKRATMALCVL